MIIKRLIVHHYLLGSVIMMSLLLVPLFVQLDASRLNQLLSFNFIQLANGFCRCTVESDLTDSQWLLLVEYHHVCYWLFVSLDQRSQKKLTNYSCVIAWCIFSCSASIMRSSVVRPSLMKSNDKVRWFGKCRWALIVVVVPTCGSFDLLFWLSC